jgi:hypothetical protein
VPFAAVFTSPRFNGPKFKSVPLKAECMEDAHAEARKVAMDLPGKDKSVSVLLQLEEHALRQIGCGALAS